VIDNIRVVVGTLSQPLVWIRPLRENAYESDEDPFDSNYLNTAKFVVERMGELQQKLVCRLNLSGSAVFLEDYFLANAPLENTVTFFPSERTVQFEIYPWRDEKAESREDVTVTLADGGSSYSVGQLSSAKFFIHDAPIAAWFAERYPQTQVGAMPQMDLAADPDGNGLCSFVEYVMGAGRGWSQPQFTAIPIQGGGVVFETLLGWNPQITDWKYAFETSTDLVNWTPIEPTVTHYASQPPSEVSRYRFTVNGGTSAVMRVNVVRNTP
jgi:hypothetical protein